MPAEWKLSPVRRRSQPRTVGPEPQAVRIGSREDEPAMSTRWVPANPRRRELPNEPPKGETSNHRQESP